MLLFLKTSQIHENNPVRCRSWGFKLINRPYGLNKQGPGPVVFVYPDYKGFKTQTPGTGSALIVAGKTEEAGPFQVSGRDL